MQQNLRAELAGLLPRSLSELRTADAFGKAKIVSILGLVPA
jgi:hypothetical protein